MTNPMKFAVSTNIRFMGFHSTATIDGILAKVRPRPATLLRLPSLGCIVNILRTCTSCHQRVSSVTFLIVFDLQQMLAYFVVLALLLLGHIRKIVFPTIIS